jgi:Ca2+-binding EF-hand superfamily protein
MGSRSILQAPKISAEQEKMIKDAFHLFNAGTDEQDEQDLDTGESSHHKSGLDKSEFAVAIKAMGFSSRDHQKDVDLIRMVDTDQDGSISLEEFTDFMKGKLSGRDPDEEIGLIFSAFVDNDEKEIITKARLASVAESFYFKLSDDELDSMFDSNISKDGNCIDYEEFMQVLKNSTWV